MKHDGPRRSNVAFLLFCSLLLKSTVLSFETPNVAFSAFLVVLPPWLHSVDFRLNHSIRSTKRCPLCSFKVPRDGDIPNSSERDAILTLAVERLTNAHFFVRTLRTTGCRARCVFFVDSAAKSDSKPEFFTVLSGCGVQLVDLGTDPIVNLTKDFLRQIVYYQFVTTNSHEIDRVLVADLFDTFFQKDPFIESFQRDRIYYSDEGYPVSHDHWNRLWTTEVMENSQLIFGIEAVADDMKREISNRNIINSGVIGGEVKLFLQHLRFMLKMGDFVAWTAYCADQGYLNVGLALGRARFPYQIDPPGSTFLGTVAMLLLRRPSAMGDQMGSFKRDGRILNVVHQGDRSRLVQDAARNSCPNLLLSLNSE
jgi:hypothetical protein